jgi:ribosomal protein L16 Arg81 hydroxylase
MTVFNARMAAEHLTGRMSLHAFNTEVREQRALKFERAFDPDQIGELFEIARLESLFASEALPLAYVDVFDDSQLTRLVDMQRKSGKTGLAIVAERFRGGSTIRVRDVDKVDARLALFVAEIRRRFAVASQINLYLTPPRKPGFAPHFDITDVFIVQCLGAKAWRLFDDYSNRVDLPLIDTNWDPDRFKPLSLPDPITLSAGDVLYLPRGVMHEAFCTDRESMHLTISLTPLTVADLIARELQRVGTGSIRFRQRVAWDVGDDSANAAERITALVKECLNELSAELDVAAVLESERRVLGASAKSGSANELTAALEALRTEAAQPSSV